MEEDGRMKNKVLAGCGKYLRQEWGDAKAHVVLEFAQEELERLIREHAGASKAVRVHTEKNIFPCVSLYRALQQCGIPKEDALSFLDRTWSQRAMASAKATAGLLHLFGLYRIYPALFSMVAKQQFGEAAGFSAHFYDMGPGRCKFDMTKCLFLDTCTRLGCPELTACFCHVDDVNNGGLHPRLCWNRSKFMGGGGDCCDFDIFVTPKGSR